MTEATDPIEEPVLTPQGEAVLRQVEDATAAAGFPIAGFAKLNRVHETLVGSDADPVNLGPTIELAVSIASDGAPLPPPGRRLRGESAAAIMIIRVAPERAFGVLCWRAWVNLVDVKTARAFFSQQSQKADDEWDAVSSATPLESTADEFDARLDDAVAALTARLPRTPGDAIAQAFGATADDGRLNVGRDWDPPIHRPNVVRMTPDEVEAATRAPTAANGRPTDGPTSSPTEPPRPARTEESTIAWRSSFVLAGVAAVIGLVVGLVVLWAGGHANADTPADRTGLMIGGLLSTTSADGVQNERVLAFRDQDRHFPVTLFRVDGPHDGCDAQHIHLAALDPAARSFEQPDTPVDDPDPTGCGFGSLDSLQPALYAIPHEQLHAFCTLYRAATPDALATDTTALCQLRDPDAIP